MLSGQLDIETRQHLRFMGSDMVDLNIKSTLEYDSICSVKEGREQI